MNEINIKSSTIEKSLDLAKDFLQKIVGSSIEEMGLLFADNVRLWRLKNQLRNLEKVKKIVKKKDIELKKVNLKVLVPYLEGVSLEEDENLQLKWANLFVNYIDSNKNLNITVYPSILGQLSSNEVQILDYLQNNKALYTLEHKRKYNNIDFEFEEILNLQRLGLIEELVEIYSPSLGSPNSYSINKSQNYILTSFGYNFIEACK